MTGADHRHELDIIAPFIDKAFYAATYQDFHEHGTDPVTHYFDIGWRLGHNPNLTFNTNFYLRRYPDVAALGVNPLLHYVHAGKSEGRRTQRPNELARARLERANDIREQSKDWAVAALTSADIQESRLIESMAENARRPLLISISHDDYPRHPGGVQSLIGDEERSAKLGGWTYLHLSPAKPLPCLADVTVGLGDFEFHLRLDGAPLGLVTAAVLLNILRASPKGITGSAIIVHHLMGHSPEVLASLRRVTAISEVVFWTHDFFSLCPSYALMRNDIAFCSAPPLTSAGCRICCYANERTKHVSRVRMLFNELNPHVLAPSSSALNLWLKRADLPYQSAVVQPLARLVLTPSSGTPHGNGVTKKIRIGYLGACVFFKGWAVFARLATELAEDSRYEFVQLGQPDTSQTPANVVNVPIHVTQQAREAMIDAVAEHDIDVVLAWPLWPETFSFVAHEAIAGGAFIITNASSGNIAVAVEVGGIATGVTLQDELELKQLLLEGRLQRLLESRDRQRGVLLLGSGSIDWLADRPPLGTK